MKPAVASIFLASVLAGAVLAQKPEQIPEPMTPLMRAAESGRVDDVRKLLSAGVNVNEKIDGIGLTSLMLAAQGGHLEVVRILLDAGADPNAAGGVVHGGFFTPLSMAMNRNNKNRLELVDLLIGAGARLNPPVSFPESPLFAAVRDNDIEMLNALLKRGSDVDWQNEIGDTALVRAIVIAEPNVEVVRLLLNAGANPNKPRLWVGENCVSIRTLLDDGRDRSSDNVRTEIRRMVVQAGGKKYAVNSNGKPCWINTHNQD